MYGQNNFLRFEINTNNNNNDDVDVKLKIKTRLERVNDARIRDPYKSDLSNITRNKNKVTNVAKYLLLRNLMVFLCR